MRLALVSLVIVTSCRSRSESQQRAEPPPVPAVPAEARSIDGEVLDVDAVRKLLPELGASLSPLRATGDGTQLHTSWCVSDPREAGEKIVESGWSNLERRGGTGPRTGMSADRDGYRMSIVFVPSSGVACKGFAVNATIYKL